MKKEKMLNVAREFADKYKVEGVVGIIFLGGLARGSVDNFSDIDITVFFNKNYESGVETFKGEIEYKGFTIDPNFQVYEDNLKSEWNMEKRWAFSEAKIYYDPEGRVKQLLDGKVFLKKEERKWLMMEGLVQSDWYINWLPEQSLERGSVLQASYVLDTGIREFLKGLFAYNNQLVPSEKWAIFYVTKLKKLPTNFEKHLEEFMKVKEISMKDIQRRQKVFNIMWKEMVPEMEKEIGMKYKEFCSWI